MVRRKSLRDARALMARVTRQIASQPPENRFELADKEFRSERFHSNFFRTSFKVSPHLKSPKEHQDTLHELLLCIFLLTYSR